MLFFWSRVHLFDFRGKTCVLAMSFCRWATPRPDEIILWRAGDTWPIGHKEPEPTEPPRMLDPIVHGMKAIWRMVNRAVNHSSRISDTDDSFQVGCWTKERVDERRALSRWIGRNFTTLPHCAIGTCKRSVFLRETVLPFDEHGMSV